MVSWTSLRHCLGPLGPPPLLQVRHVVPHGPAPDVESGAAVPHPVHAEGGQVRDDVGGVVDGDGVPLLLLHLGVLSAWTDGVHGDSPLLLVQLPLQQPRVAVDRQLGDRVGAVRPALGSPGTRLDDRI